MTKGQLGIFKVLLCFSLVGCSGKFEAQKALEDVNNGNLDKKGERPACEIQATEYALDTKMVSFEIVSNNGATFGFDLLTNFFKMFQLSFKTKTGRMALAMSLYDPMNPEYELMNVLGSSKMNESSFKFDISFQQIGLGFEHYSKTPLSKLAEKGLDDTLGRLVNEINKLQDPWSTQVVATPSKSEMVVPVGSFTGLQVGDEFAVYNVEHIWSGTPCSSQHLIARKTTPYPVAIVVASQVEKNAAMLTVVTRDEYSDINRLEIEKGALVEVHKLVDSKRKLLRSLEIKSVTGAQMVFENNQAVDLSGHLADQIRAVVHRHGFMIYDGNK